MGDTPASLLNTMPNTLQHLANWKSMAAQFFWHGPCIALSLLEHVNVSSTAGKSIAIKQTQCIDQAVATVCLSMKWLRPENGLDFKQGSALPTSRECRTASKGRCCMHTSTHTTWNLTDHGAWVRFFSQSRACGTGTGNAPQNNIGRIKEGGLAHGKIGGRLSFAFKSGIQQHYHAPYTSQSIPLQATKKTIMPFSLSSSLLWHIPKKRD